MLMFKQKTKKRKTLRKQWMKNIMLLVFGIFITIGISLYYLLQTTVTAAITSSLSGLSSIAAYELEGRETSDLMQNKENSDIYKRIDKGVDFLFNKTQNLVDRFYIIYSDKSGQWCYIMDKSKNSGARFGDPYTDTTHEDIRQQAIKTGLPADAVIDYGKDSLLTSYIPVKTNDGINALICIALNEKVINNLKILVAAVLAALMSLAMFCVFLVVNRITKKQTKSIEKLLEKIKSMAEMEGDLTQRIDINSNDEIGELAEYTNKMFSSIQNILIKVQKLAVHLADTSSGFAQAFEAETKSFQKMDSFTKELASRVQSEASELALAAENINEIDHSLSQIANNSQIVVESSLDMNRNALEGNQVMELLISRYSDIDSVVMESSEQFSHLASKSELINSIADTISAIAAQTNLLALNASIEAARAGEQGKGFTVVADEIRKLAEESSKSAKEIYQLIQEVRKGIETAGNSMEIVADKTSEGSRIVEETKNKFGEIGKSIRHVSKMLEEVSAASEEMSAGTTLVAEKLESISEISSKNSGGIAEVAVDIDNQNNIIKSLSEKSTELSSISVELANGLSRLKLE